MTILLSQDLSEDIIYVPIVTNVVDANKRVGYSVPISLLAGDFMEVFSQFEVTNNQGYNVGVGSTLILASSAAAVMGEVLSIAKPCVENVTPAMHHQIRHMNGRKLINADWSGYVNLVLWAGASSAMAGNMLILEKGYGGLDVVVNR